MDFVNDSQNTHGVARRPWRHVQINDTTGVDGTERDRFAAAVTAALGSHHDRITRVEVHLAHDTDRPARPPMRCTIEARPAGDAALAVTHVAPSCSEAVRGAGQRLRRRLDAWAGRRDAFSRDSVRLARPEEEPATTVDHGPAGRGTPLS